MFLYRSQFLLALNAKFYNFVIGEIAFLIIIIGPDKLPEISRNELLRSQFIIESSKANAQLSNADWAAESFSLYVDR